MRYIVLIISSISLFQASLSQADFSKNYFAPPLDIDMYLSGNFGELRSDHFHAGIDIKTQGTIGLKVYAAAEGYVSRIKIEAAGYGNTLYITHPGGYTTVYAHLDRFRKDIAEHVLQKQYADQVHVINIFPGKEEFPVQKGEIVAYSGTSGYSFGPHLHFEIRDAANQEPMNALSFGLNIKDLVAPKIFSVYMYRTGDENTGSLFNEKGRYAVTGLDGKYHIESGDTISASGNTGFGIEAFDYLNGSNNRCGIYRIRMLVDDELVYVWTMDRFSFSMVRYVNSYIDYEEKARNQKLVQKTFIEPNNQLNLYSNVINRGIINFSEHRIYKMKFILEDAYENISELDFLVLGGEEGQFTNKEETPSYIQEFNYMEENEFERDNILLKIPQGALYTNLKFNYNQSPQPAGSFAALHSLHDPYTALQLACELSIRPEGLPEELREKALIGMLDEEGKMVSAGGEWKEGMVRTQIREFGNYTVVCDTTGPEIISLDLDGSGIPVEKKSIGFKVIDELSGIKSYEGYIDNNWVLFEYDTKNDLVFYRFDPERLSSAKNHELELYIIDNKENIAYYYAEFYW